VADAEDCQTTARLTAAHDIRARFERWALPGLLAVLGVYCLIMLVGVLWRPAPAGLVDWGNVIVQRAISIRDALLDVCGALASVLGITMTRGHMDARLDK
jgi:hypothetical protein